MTDKQVRVDEEVYARLEGLMKPRQSFNAVIFHLLEQHRLDHESWQKYRGYMKTHSHTPPQPSQPEP